MTWEAVHAAQRLMQVGEADEARASLTDKDDT